MTNEGKSVLLGSDDPRSIHPDLAPGAPGVRAWKASDISDTDFLAAVEKARGDRYWILRMEVEDQFPELPWKVVLAKARSLIKRKLMEGCACGCRGDYRLTPAGFELLKSREL